MSPPHTHTPNLYPSQATHEEMVKPDGIFRKMEDPLMSSMLITMPVFSAIGLAWLRSVLKVPLSPDNPMGGVTFALAVWVTQSMHGIFIDYQSYRESYNVPLMFMLSSGLSSAVSGFLLATFMVKSKTS